VNGCEQYLNAINELVDGTLGPLRRAELDLHLEGCESCRALLADLQTITRSAEGLPPLNPPDRVWMQIAGRLHQEGRVTSAPVTAARSRNYPVLALAAALLLAVGSSLFVLFPRDRPASTPVAGVAPNPDQHEATTAGNTDADDLVQGIDSELAAGEQHFIKALDEMTKVRGDLDPETVKTLQKEMLVMNKALAETRAAIRTDPQSAAARQSFYDVLKQKIQFLQDTIALMNKMRQGDAAGAAQIVEGGKS
jgi:hypothetical protein